jgi:tyrosyl-tRNA synthetase
MFAKIMSISDDLMWKYFDLLSSRGKDEVDRLRAETDAGRNPRDAKVALAKEITARFHGAAAAEGGEADFNLRAKGGIPDEIEAIALSGAPLGIGAVLKQARLAPSTSEAMRLVEGGGVRVDGTVIADRALKLPAGTFVVQVGKRKFARVTLS